MVCGSRKLVVCRCLDGMLPPETIEMHLHSCNATAVKADVTLTYVNQMDAKRNLSSGSEAFLLPKTAHHVQF